MSNKLYEESNIMEIANAIRTKGGTTTLLKVSDMAQAIADIPTTGTPTIETLNVTTNGTYTAPSDVDGYSPVSVNVPQGYLCKISRTFTEDTSTNKVTITHNIGSTDYLFDVFIDERPDVAPSVNGLISSSSTTPSDAPSPSTVCNYADTGNVVRSTSGSISAGTNNTVLYTGSLHYLAGHTYTFYFYAK